MAELSNGAKRAALACMRLSGKVSGDIPDAVLAEWGAVTDMAVAIEKNTGAAGMARAINETCVAEDWCIVCHNHPSSGHSVDCALARCVAEVTNG